MKVNALKRSGSIFNNHRFSKRLVMIYTCIVVVPLAVIFIILMAIYKSSFQNEVEDNSRHIVLNEFSDLQRRMESVDRIEKIINSNAALLSFLMSPQEYSETETISTVISATDSLEKILAVETDLSSLRIFADNENVPERSPVLFHSDRTDLDKLERWEFDYNPFYIYGGSGLGKTHLLWAIANRIKET